MRTSLLCLCWLYSCWGYGQEQEYSSDSAAHQMILKISPLSLLNNNPAIQAGLEFKLNDRYYLQPEIGVSIPAIFHPQNRGLKLRTELRQYLNRKPPRRTRRNRPLAYKSIELYGSQNRYTEFALFEFNGNFIDEEITIRRTITGVNVKIGRLKLYRDTWVLDYFVGGGIKFRHIKHLDRQVPGNFLDEGLFVFERKDEGSTLMANFVVGVKLGYVLR